MNSKYNIRLESGYTAWKLYYLAISKSRTKECNNSLAVWITTLFLVFSRALKYIYYGWTTPYLPVFSEVVRSLFLIISLHVMVFPWLLNAVGTYKEFHPTSLFPGSSHVARGTDKHSTVYIELPSSLACMLLCGAWVGWSLAWATTLFFACALYFRDLDTTFSLLSFALPTSSPHACPMYVIWSSTPVRVHIAVHPLVRSLHSLSTISGPRALRPLYLLMNPWSSYIRDSISPSTHVRFCSSFGRRRLGLHLLLPRHGMPRHFPPPRDTLTHMPCNFLSVGIPFTSTLECVFSNWDFVPAGRRVSSVVDLYEFLLSRR